MLFRSLQKMYCSGEWKPLKAYEYVDLASSFLGRQRDGLIVMRLVADCPDAILVAPRWSETKTEIENAIMNKLKENDILVT